VLLERIRALAVPPAWEDVWICPDERGHLQATGRDAKGRKQYRYHPEWRAFRDRVKFKHLVAFADALPQIRKKVDADLGRSGVPKEKVLATVVRLLETTLIRVGNEEYVRDNDSYGLTTMRCRHVRVDREALRFVFRGKSGQAHEVELSDERLARIIRRCQELPGQQLFQYVDEDGSRCAVQSGDVNDYLREAAGTDVTAKDFRTWVASVLATTALVDMPRAKTKTARTRALNVVLDVVASELGNTRAVCRASYIHPVVLDAFVDGSLHDRWERAPARGPRGLIAEERKLLALLKARRRSVRTRVVVESGARRVRKRRAA
jgi:DNA topoisomerase-1